MGYVGDMDTQAPSSIGLMGEGEAVIQVLRFFAIYCYHVLIPKVKASANFPCIILKGRSLHLHSLRKYRQDSLLGGDIQEIQKWPVLLSQKAYHPPLPTTDGRQDAVAILGAFGLPARNHNFSVAILDRA